MPTAHDNKNETNEIKNETKNEIQEEHHVSPTTNNVLLHKNGIAGAVAGVMTAFLTCPLDVVRTRLQVQHLQQGPKYSGLREALSMILKTEGPLGFFKGLGPQVLGFVPSWAIYFTVYDHLKPLIAKATDDKLSSSFVHMLSAVGAGAITNLGTTPFFTVKTRLQTQQTIFLKQQHMTDTKKAEGNKRVIYTGTWDAFKKIIQNEGPRVLWSGLMPSMIGLIHVGIQFPLYEKFKSIAQSRKPTKETPLSLPELFLCAAGSKLFASAAAYPHEVIRSRLQGQGGLGVEKKYRGVVDVVKITIKEEGVRGLYSGLGVTLLRTIPAAVITLSAYEETKQIIEKWAADK